MPYAPLSLCLVTGCANLVPRGRCAEHEAQVRKERPSATARGYDREWRKTRDAFLRVHPMCECEECAALPSWKRPVATDVDHRDGMGPHGPRGHDWSNLAALTHAHHARKTAAQDGGFGRPRSNP
jgi:5-methylcytosine-specific restriction protein A